MSDKNRYLDSSELKIFKEFIEAEKIGMNDLAEMEGLGRRRETMNARFKREKVLRGFANQIVEIRQQENQARADKFKNLRF